METINKKDLSERDICTKFVTLAIVQAGWNLYTQIRLTRSQADSERLMEAVVGRLLAGKGGKSK